MDQRWSGLPEAGSLPAAGVTAAWRWKWWRFCSEHRHTQSQHPPGFVAQTLNSYNQINSS